MIQGAWSHTVSECQCLLSKELVSVDKAPRCVGGRETMPFVGLRAVLPDHCSGLEASGQPLCHLTMDQRHPSKRSLPRECIAPATRDI